MHLFVFEQNCKKKKMEMEIFAFYILTFEPIISKTCSAPQNDCHNLSFVKDEHTYGKKIVRKGSTKVIYKGTFISKQSLFWPWNEFNEKAQCGTYIAEYFN